MFIKLALTTAIAALIGWCIYQAAIAPTPGYMALFAALAVINAISLFVVMTS